MGTPRVLVLCDQYKQLSNDATVPNVVISTADVNLKSGCNRNQCCWFCFIQVSRVFCESAEMVLNIESIALTLSVFSVLLS